MAFYKTFPRNTEKSAYPVWEEVSLSDAEETEQEVIARRENIDLMKECLKDARVLLAEANMRSFETNIVNLAISLFEKRASHQVYYKERKAKEKFDAKLTS